jgi:hypothetical protein
MLEFYGGCTAMIVPHNLRSGVSKACRYDPDINPSYQQWAEHFSLAVIPARPRKPKDKAKAEVAVQVVERWILARLRHHAFFSACRSWVYRMFAGPVGIGRLPRFHGVMPAPGDATTHGGEDCAAVRETDKQALRHQHTLAALIPAL